MVEVERGSMDVCRAAMLPKKVRGSSFTGPARGAAWIRRCFPLAGVEQRSRKAELRVHSHQAAEDSDSQSRQTRLWRVRVLGGIFGRLIASFQGSRSYIPWASDDMFPEP